MSQDLPASFRAQTIFNYLPIGSTRQLLTAILTLVVVVLFQITILNPFHYKLIWNAVRYDEDNCGCPRYGPLITANQNHSFCSNYATSRGKGQKIVSYAIYGNASDKTIARKFYDQVEDRLKEVRKYYEGWIVRLYHNKKPVDKLMHEFICNLYCKYDHFDPCQMRHLELPEWVNKSLNDGSLTDISKVKQSNPVVSNMEFLYNLNDHLNNIFKIDTFPTDFNSEDTSPNMFLNYFIGKTWRFIVTGDPTVSEFLVRDIDSFILPREVAAVLEWLHNSTATIHAMRDHPSHNGQILAGLWGGSRRRNETKMTKIFLNILKIKPQNVWDFDQTILRKVVWPEAFSDIIIHDSYHCRNPFLLPKHLPVPFPTQRDGKLFVSWGPARSKTELDNIVECPFVCRPREHTDWKFC